MKKNLPLLALLFISYFSFFVHPEILPADIMEARNFVTAREMLEYDHWLVPTMNGEVRLTKPPLPTWLTAISAKLGGGIHDYSSLRFPAAAMAMLMVFFLYGLVRTFTEDKLLPFIAAAVLASSLYVILMGRNGSWDIFSHSFMLGGLWALSYGWNKKSPAYTSFVLAGVAMGLSFMSKGPVPFYSLLLPFFISYIASFGFKKVRAKWKEGFVALGICILIGGAWPLYTVLTVPDELAKVIAVESTAWVERHVRPFWYYWNFPVQIGLWVIFVVVALIFPYARKRIDYFGRYTFIIGWLLGTIFLLSLVPEKKVKYLLPAMVPMALATGYLVRYFIEVFRENKQDRWDEVILKINTAIVALVSFAIPLFLYSYILPEADIPAALLIVFIAVFTGMGLLLFYLYRKKAILHLFCSYIAVMSLALLCILPYIPLLLISNPGFHSPKNIASLDKVKDLKLYSTEIMRIELVWEAGKSIEVWQYRKDQEPLNNLPIAVFSEKPLHQYFPKAAKDSLSFIPVDKYDMNRGKSAKPFFIKYLTVIKGRQQP